MFERIDGMRTIEFGTPGPSREKLVNLILHGQKRATAGLLIGDYDKAKDTLGWTPTVGFEQLIQMMVDADLERLG